MSTHLSIDFRLACSIVKPLETPTEPPSGGYGVQCLRSPLAHSVPNSCDVIPLSRCDMSE